MLCVSMYEEEIIVPMNYSVVHYPTVRGGGSQTEGGGPVLVPQEAQPTVPPLLQGLQGADPRGQSLSNAAVAY